MDSAEHIKVACDALRADGHKWEDVASTLVGSLATANNLAIPATDVAASPVTQDFLKAYGELLHGTTELLGGAAKTTATLSQLLISAADTYEGEDHAGAQRINQTTVEGR